ncbi:hypothetical protein [Oceanithermus sp.]
MHRFFQPWFQPDEIERIEHHERAVGIEHVTVLDRAAQITSALHARGYGIQARPEPGPRDGEVIWHATASVWRPCCKGGSQHPHPVAWATGATQEQALRALAGELGVEL